VGVETEPNDLKDSRDKLLGDLAKLTDFQGVQMHDGLYAVTINGHTLVQDETFVPLVVSNDPLNSGYAQITWSDDNSLAVMSEGEIAGLKITRDTEAAGYRQSLDQLAQGLINAINPVHAAGYALNTGTPSGEVFFTGTTIQDIDINPILIADPSQLAAASNPNAPGDGSNALALAQLQNALTMSGNTMTFGTYYQGLVAQVGLDSQHNQVSLNTQTQLLSNMDQQRESISGVSLDEETTNMMKFQDGYNAAIRVISVMDSMLDTLINKMGVS
jgi:flagellar hook-associated protein 1